MILSRPVNPRARRTASRVDSVPLLVKRHCGWWNRRASSRATTMFSSTGWAKCDPAMNLRIDRGDDRGMRMADDHDPEPVVEVDVLVAVDVPDAGCPSRDR